ncbi:MAG: AI-2E family transporter [Bacteroidales bacterium]|nr:AI-2E family transporter [Bacteroidales bacterium]
MNSDKFQFPQVAKWVISILSLGLIFFLIWYFRFIVVCILLALILAFMGAPVQDFLSKIRFRNFGLGKTMTTTLTLLLFVGIFALLVYFVVPMLVSQAMTFANLDVYKIADYYAEPIKKIEMFLYEYQIMPSNTNLEKLVSAKIMGAFDIMKLTNMADSIVNFASNFLMGTFIVLFLTFFFLKDKGLVGRFIDSITPDTYLDEVNKIISSSRVLISRYFIGIFCEIICMITLLSIGFYLVGLPNVLLIACVCGVMVILPYLGVLIGGGIGLVICLTTYLSVDASLDIVPIILKFVAVFSAVKLIDDFVLQPLIYSKSVKAHPLEVFLVILMAGELGGVIGMILAIPVYTLFRIIAKEFFIKWKFIKKITANLE